MSDNHVSFTGIDPVTGLPYPQQPLPAVPQQNSPFIPVQPAMHVEQPMYPNVFPTAATFMPETSAVCTPVLGSPLLAEDAVMDNTPIMNANVTDGSDVDETSNVATRGSPVQESLVPPTVVPAAAEGPLTWTRSEVCGFMQRQSFCRWGFNCPYKHTDDSGVDPRGDVVHYKTIRCVFHDDGYCALGSGCFYLHVGEPGWNWLWDNDVASYRSDGTPAVGPVLK